MADFYIERLPKRMHRTAINLNANKDYIKLKEIFIEHKLVSCPGCLTIQTVKLWTEYAISKNIWFVL